MESIIKNIANEVKAEDGDYIGEDGLLYCGKCHTKKQVRLTLPSGQVVTPRCICKCEKGRIDKEEQEQRDREKIMQIERYRSVGFADKELKRCRFSIDDNKNAEITNVAKNYVKKFDYMKKNGRGLLLYGGVGTGKTFIASCIANALIDECIPCMVTNISRIVNQLSGMFEGKQAYIDSLSKYSLLVIDDFGMERSTDYVNEIVYNVIDTRYRSGLPLIVTTNLSDDDMKNTEDLAKKRIYSRILEMCFPVSVGGTDRRKDTSYGDMMEKLYE